MAALVAGAGVAALSWQAPERAFACSGPSTIQQLAMSPKVFAGRITAVEEDASLSDSIYRVFRLQIDVSEGIRGTVPGERLQAIARVPGPVPVMCPQFERDETFLGKWVVTGLYAGDGPPQFSRWGTAYLGMDPGGVEYAEALRAARVAVGGGSGLPTITLAPATLRCGSTVSVSGAGFAPGQPVLLNYPAEPDETGAFIHPTVTADGSGRFVFSFRVAAAWCPLDWWIEAYEWREDGQIGGWPLALVPIKVTGLAAPLPPDAGNSGAAAESPRSRWWPAAGLTLVVLASVAFASRRLR